MEIRTQDQGRIHRRELWVDQIANQQALFQKLCPELERRIASLRRAPCGRLTMRTDIGTTTLQVREDTVQVCQGEGQDMSIELSQAKLIKPIVGYRSARDVLNDPEVRARKDVVPLLDALFPRGYPYVWLADYF